MGGLRRHLPGPGGGAGGVRSRDRASPSASRSNPAVARIAAYLCVLQKDPGQPGNLASSGKLRFQPNRGEAFPWYLPDLPATASSGLLSECGRLIVSLRCGWEVAQWSSSRPPLMMKACGMNEQHLNRLAQQRRACRANPLPPAGLARLRYRLKISSPQSAPPYRLCAGKARGAGLGSSSARRGFGGRALFIVTRFSRPMNIRRCRAGAQPQPRKPGLSRKMVRAHASRVFRDVVPVRPLSYHEWRLVEEDLARRLENHGW
jgi:hypothetical protein